MLVFLNLWKIICLSSFLRFWLTCLLKNVVVFNDHKSRTDSSLAWWPYDTEDRFLNDLLAWNGIPILLLFFRYFD